MITDHVPGTRRPRFPQVTYPDPMVSADPLTAGGLAMLAYRAVVNGSPLAAELTARAARAYLAEKGQNREPIAA